MSDTQREPALRRRARWAGYGVSAVAGAATVGLIVGVGHSAVTAAATGSTTATTPATTGQSASTSTSGSGSTSVSGVASNAQPAGGSHGS